MTTKAGAGHFGPLIPFARAFQRAGADVLIAAPREAAPMVRAEGLPLWAFDDPPAAERDAIFAEVRGKHDRRPRRQARRGRHLRAHRRRARPSRAILAACRAWAPDVVVSETTEFAGPLAAEVVGVPSACVGLSQQGKEEHVLPVVIAAIDELRARFGLPPDPAGAAPAAPAVLHALPRRARGPGHADAARVAPLPRDAPDRAPAPRSTGARRTSARSSTSTFGSVVADHRTSIPGIYRAAIDALAALPLRLLVTVGRDRDPADARAGAGQRARRALGAAGRPHAPRRGDASATAARAP